MTELERIDYEQLAEDAGRLAQWAYEAAERSGNPFAAMVVTQKLADANLIRLDTARRVVSRSAA